MKRSKQIKLSTIHYNHYLNSSIKKLVHKETQILCEIQKFWNENFEHLDDQQILSQDNKGFLIFFLFVNRYFDSNIIFFYDEIHKKCI